MDERDPEDVILDNYYAIEMEKEFDQWELTGYWNALNEQGNSQDSPKPKQQNS